MHYLCSAYRHERSRFRENGRRHDKKQRRWRSEKPNSGAVPNAFRRSRRTTCATSPSSGAATSANRRSSTCSPAGRDSPRSRERPRKTRLINHFRIDNAWYLVDLPGYGYARTSKSVRGAFSKLITDYVLRCERLHYLFVLVDIRLEPQKIDLQFIEMLGMNGIPLRADLHKADKLSKAQRQKSLRTLRPQLAESWEELPPMLVSSSRKRHGARGDPRFHRPSLKKFSRLLKKHAAKSALSILLPYIWHHQNPIVPMAIHKIKIFSGRGSEYLAQKSPPQASARRSVNPRCCVSATVSSSLLQRIDPRLHRIHHPVHVPDNLMELLMMIGSHAAPRPKGRGRHALLRMGPAGPQGPSRCRSAPSW